MKYWRNQLLIFRAFNALRVLALTIELLVFYKTNMFYTSFYNALLLPVSFFGYEVSMCTCRSKQMFANLCFIGQILSALLTNIDLNLKKVALYKNSVLALKCACIFKNSFWHNQILCFFYNIQLSSIKSFISVLRLAPGVNDKSKLKVCNQSDRGLCSLSSNFVLWKKWCDFVTLDLACLFNKTKWLL